MFIKPKPGLIVRDPELRDYLPSTGRVVMDTPYWQRRLSDGDVEIIAPEPKKPIVAKKNDGDAA